MSLRGPFDVQQEVVEERSVPRPGVQALLGDRVEPFAGRTAVGREQCRRGFEDPAEPEDVGGGTRKITLRLVETRENFGRPRLRARGADQCPPIGISGQRRSDE